MSKLFNNVDMTDKNDLLPDGPFQNLTHTFGSNELEFTDEQLARLDAVQEAAETFLGSLAETDDKVWDLDDIWNVIYLGCQLLHKRGRKVRLPTHVTTKDGTEYITDWYEDDEEKPGADIRHGDAYKSVPENQPVYVDKRHYDCLLRAYSCLKRENADLRKAWSDLKDSTARFDDRVLEDIHRFDSLQEENAYLIGAFNSLLAIRYNIEDLEGKIYVSPCNKQNSL